MAEIKRSEEEAKRLAKQQQMIDEEKRREEEKRKIIEEQERDRLRKLDEQRRYRNYFDIVVESCEECVSLKAFVAI